MTDAADTVIDPALQTAPVLRYEITYFDPKSDDPVTFEQECAGIDVLAAEGSGMAIAFYDATPSPQGFIKQHFRAIAGVVEFVLLTKPN